MGAGKDEHSLPQAKNVSLPIFLVRLLLGGYGTNGGDAVSCDVDAGLEELLLMQRLSLGEAKCLGDEEVMCFGFSYRSSCRQQAYSMCHTTLLLFPFVFCFWPAGEQNLLRKRAACDSCQSAQPCKTALKLQKRTLKCGLLLGQSIYGI